VLKAKKTNVVNLVDISVMV